MVNGVTALEALCHNWKFIKDDEATIKLAKALLKAGATVNRPIGMPSHAIHGAISKGWRHVLARFLEPQHDAVVSHFWGDPSEATQKSTRKTPVQLAASIGSLEMVEMLLNHGGVVNDEPYHRFGRTALQAASSLEPGPAKMKLVEFLITHGAEVNAEPAVHGGVTALQAAAISGDLQLVEMLISKGADVNGRAAFEQGRYAVEGAAEHCRLDMVQMLLNAGARGSVHDRRGFKRAIELAQENGHFAIVNILEAEQARLCEQG